MPADLSGAVADGQALVMPGRNRACPCGSGRRYKECCGSLAPSKLSTGGRVALNDTTQSHRETLLQATREGDANAAARLGFSLLTGQGGPPNTAQGVALIEQAAAAGDAQGAAWAATVSSSNLWRRRNWEAALDYLERAARCGHAPSQGALRILAGGPLETMAGGGDWSAMRSGIDLQAWLSPPVPTVERTAPSIQVIENFVHQETCEWLIEQARDRMTRATIYDRDTGGDTEDPRRLNSQCDLDIEHAGVLTFVLRARIGALTGRPDQAMEVPKVLHYAPGETFAEHCDYLDPAIPAYAAELAARGQRIETFLIYLNNDFSGGETWFPELDFSHRGAMGDALLFSNVTEIGLPDETTRHAGMPPKTGEKWVFSQWIRGLPTPG